MTTTRTTCAFDCPDRCSVLVHADPRSGITLSGDPDHPFTRGTLCRKIRRHPARLSAPERIRGPWMREGRRDGRFRPASWDEALAAAADAINRARSADPARILHLRSAGSMGVGKGFADYIFGLLGARGVAGSLCEAAGAAAIEEGAGANDMNDPDEIEAADAVVLWGKNPRASSVHTAARVVAARRRGARVVAVTPDAAGVRGLADHVISLRPGTDRFLALAVIHLLLERERQTGPAGGTDAGAPPRPLADGTRAFEELLARNPVADLLAACEVGSDEAGLLAEVYALVPRTATVVGWGLQRYESGGESVRMIHTLAFLAGTLGREGGGFYYSMPGSRYLETVDSLLARDRDPAAGPPAAAARPLDLPLLAREIAAADPPIDAAWLTATNIVNQGADSTALREAFSRIPTVVAVEAFWTETAKAATIVLPPALWLEEEDVVGSYWRDELAAVRAATPPPAGCRTDFDILIALADRLGLAHPYPTLDDWLRARLPAGGPSLEALRAEGWRHMGRPRIAYSDGFPRPGGRFLLPDTLSAPTTPDEAFPLHLLTLIRGDATHSQMLPGEQTEPLAIRLHPATAARLGLAEGARARVTTRVGALEGVVATDAGLHPGAVACPRGGWLEFGLGVNAATEAAPTDMGGGTAFYSTTARVGPA